MIPDFQTIMLPILKSFKESEIISSKELRFNMINHFKITEQEQKEKTPSGKQFTYSNRIAWAIAYLKMAKLISSPKRGSYQITEIGVNVLKNPPEKITISFLKQFENFSTNKNPEEETEEKNSNNTSENVLIRQIYDIILSEGFTFSPQQITNYYLSLKTKPFVILTGISGTGKTKITELFANAVCNDFKNQYLLLPVRPDWNDDRNLLGYYNPLTKQYQTTPFLDFIIKAAQDPENPYFVCLDEMNLARVEYYFSTFLSAMESGSKEISLPGYGTIKAGDGKEMLDKIIIPLNLFFTGTVNMDETTYRFSPKVLDRANTLEFHEIDLMRSRDKQDTSLDNPDLIEPFKELFLKDDARIKSTESSAYQDWETKNWKDLASFLDQLNKEALEKSNLHFGYRIRDEILRYMYFAETLSSDDFTTETALDLQIKQKILPRIKGPESIREALKSLRDIIQKYPQSTAKLDRMIGALDNGYTHFYQ